MFTQLQGIHMQCHIKIRLQSASDWFQWGIHVSVHMTPNFLTQIILKRICLPKNTSKIGNEKIHALHLKKSLKSVWKGTDFRSSFRADLMLTFSVSKISRVNILLQPSHLCQLDKPRIGFHLHQEYHFIHWQQAAILKAVWNCTKYVLSLQNVQFYNTTRKIY